MVISIDKAEYKDEYKILLVFSDGIEKTIDFDRFLSNSLNPMNIKYRDKDEFKKFRIVHGDLVWSDYELCFPIWDLHEGKI